MNEPPPAPRYVLRGGGSVSYTVEGLESLAFLGKITPDTEVAPAGTARFERIRDASFYLEVFPPKQTLSFRQRPEVYRAPEAPIEGHVDHSTSVEELKARIARDPNDAYVHLLAIRLKQEMRDEGLTSSEVFARFFAQNRQAQEPVPLNETLIQRILGKLR